MLNEAGRLHCEKPFGPTPRTRQKRDAGSPLIHGSASGTEAAGESTFASQIRALSARKSSLVESWNWYRVAPRTWFHANAGVREYVGTGRDADGVRDSCARRRNVCRPLGVESSLVGFAAKPTAVNTAALTAISTARAV